MHPAGPMLLPGAPPPGPPPQFPAPPPPEPPRWPRVLLTIATVLVGIGIAAGTIGLQGFVWLAGEADGSGTTPGALVAVGWINAVLIAGPSGLIWLLAGRVTPRPAGLRAAGRAWTLAGVAGGIVGTARAVSVPHNEILLVLTAVLAAATALVVHFVPRDPVPAGQRRPLTGFGVAAGLAVALPWLLFGALGGATETVAAVLAAAAVGWLAAELLDGAFFHGYNRSRPWMFFVGGLVAGVTLVPIGMGLGGAGLNLAALVILPALGFAAAAVAAASGPGRPAVATMVALAALGPLALVDPEETSLTLGFEDVGLWAFIAGIVSVLLAYVVGGAYGLALNPRRVLDRWIPAGAAILLVVVAGAAYGLGGRPGLHGDQLFVVMAEQADLSGLDQIANRDERLTATYTRLVEHANRTQASIRADLDGLGLDYTPYYLVNGLVVDGGPIIRAWLSGRSDVDRVLIDQRLRPLPVAAATTTGTDPAPAPNKNQPGITMLHADRVWSELGDRGQSIVIGTSDSGVDGTHPALKDGFRGGDDSWYDPWNNTTTPTDHGGHGTHTLGSAVGNLGIGVAPDAQWVGCVNLDRNYGSPSRYLDCLQFMLAPFPLGGNAFRDGRPARAPHVLTNSWGCPTIEGCDAGALRPATAALKAAGVFVVVAAGNSGPECESIVDSPAHYPDVFTVGAVDGQGAVAGFSSRGPVPNAAKPDVVAPGVDVLSALPGGTYGALSGTSMATPHVAGVVALMWRANPSLIGDIDTTAKILRDTAVRAEARSRKPGDSCGAVTNTTGAGIVDAYAAVKAAVQDPTHR